MLRRLGPPLLCLWVTEPRAREILAIAVLQVLEEQNVDRHAVPTDVLDDLLGAHVHPRSSDDQVVGRVDRLWQVALLVDRQHVEALPEVRDHLATDPKQVPEAEDADLGFDDVLQSRLGRDDPWGHLENLPAVDAPKTELDWHERDSQSPAAI